MAGCFAWHLHAQPAASDGSLRCPHCSSLNVQTACKHKSMPFRCHEQVCGWKRFRVRTGTVMESLKVSYHDWIIAMLLTMTLTSANLKNAELVERRN